MMTRLEVTFKTFEIAAVAEYENDICRARMLYDDILTDLIHLSLYESTTVAELKTWLTDKPFEQATAKFILYTNVLLQRLEDGSGPTHGLTGNYLHIAYAHFFAMLGDFERSEYFTVLGARLDIAGEGRSNFWDEYGQTLAALTGRRSYRPAFDDLCTMEHYWMPYVDLMKAAMAHDPLDNAISRVNYLFAKRNKDKRNLDDAYMIEGTGEKPLQIDFRKEGLMALIKHLGMG